MHKEVLEALEFPDNPTIWEPKPGFKREEPSIRERLFANTIRNDDGCLVRQYEKHDRYPTISIRNRMVQSSRVIFYLTHGYEPMVVRHTCDNPLCVEPSHLIAGTYLDNTNDIRVRGRQLGRAKEDICKRGHRMTPDNRYKSGDCKECARIRSREHHRGLR